MHRRYAPESDNAIVSHQEFKLSGGRVIGLLLDAGRSAGVVGVAEGVDVIYKTPYGTWRA